MKRRLDTAQFRALVKEGKAPAPEQAPVIRRATIGFKSIDEGQRIARFVISDATRDRARDSLDPKGMKAEAYTKNPVFLYAHNYSLDPIGICVELPTLQGEQIVAGFKFYEASVNPDAERRWQMVKAGGLRAVSVGFQPLKMVWNEEAGGIDFIEWELLETSLVPVPCNPNALLVDSKAIEDVELYLKGLKAEGESPPEDGAEESIAAYMADLAQASKGFGELHEKYSKLYDRKAAVVERLEKAVAAVESDAGADDQDDAEGGDKGAKPRTKGAGSGHKLSSRNMKRLKAMLRSGNEMVADHHLAQGAPDGEPDGDEPTEPEGDEGTGDEKDKGQKPTTPTAPELTEQEKWEAECRAKGLDPKAVLAEAAQRELARQRGKFD